MKNKAAIDIGSNSVQFLVIDENRKQLFREQYVTGLGRGVAKNGHFDEESIRDTIDALKNCLSVCKDLFVESRNIKATATEASRKAKNSKDFYAQVSRDLNLEVEIITGEREAYLSTKGLVEFGENTQSDVLIDIGGASTELTLFSRDPFEIISSISIPLGSVKLKVLSEKNQTAKEFLKGYDLSAYQSEEIIGISGTATSITAMNLKLKEFDESKVNNKLLTLNEVSTIAENLINRSSEDILLDFPFLGKRAPVVAYGTQIMASIMEILGASSVLTSTKGLVHGSILTI